MAKIRNTGNSKCWQGSRVTGYLIYCGNKIVQPLWKTVWQSLRKQNICLLHDPEIPLPCIYAREICPHKDLYMNIYSSFIPKSQKLEITPKSLNKWMVNKPQYSHIMEYCSAIKINGLLICTTTWISLKCIMLRKKTDFKTLCTV